MVPLPVVRFVSTLCGMVLDTTEITPSIGWPHCRVTQVTCLCCVYGIGKYPEAD